MTRQSAGLAELLAAGAPIVPVIVYGQLAGLLTPEHLTEFVRVGGRRRHGAAPVVRPGA